ncbi:SDR family oxidoreductase [Paenibacillus montaniterrae]|nr:SDR family oxidoreductase [Paenibacillus montaniterrae]
MTNLQGKVAIVTGASRGIGSSIAKQLAALGASVVVNYARSTEEADALVEDIVGNGGSAAAIAADISKLDDIQALFAQTIAAYGKVDILVNNAGYMNNQMIEQVTEEEFDKHFAINVKGTYFTCQQAMQHMENNGRIINISTSVAGHMFPAYSVYAGTKGAVEQFTRQLAKEFGAKGITINAIAPGPVRTELFLQGKSEQQVEAISNMNAFKRLGEPQDIAGVIAFLASEEASWVTGQTLRVNGGFI